jgi:hypothetical protein
MLLVSDRSTDSSPQAGGTMADFPAADQAPAQLCRRHAPAD